MAWTNFTHAEVFGTRVFRPYSDFLAEVEAWLDGLLVPHAEICQGFIPLHQRDLVFCYGVQGSLLVISSGKRRHLPMHIAGDMAAIHPDYRHANLLPDAATKLTATDLPADFIEVIKQVDFVDPVVIALPTISFIAAQQDDRRERVSREAAAIVFHTEQRRYMNQMEHDTPKRIFLSHRSIDKALVRDVAATLREIGFDPWLDEDAMPAGANLERALKDGMLCSCAAVFFLTGNFEDESWLGTEIDYAIAEKRKKKDRFAIVPLLMESELGRKGKILEMIEQYVHKDVKHHQIVREILRALPIKMQTVGWKG